jgi:hypothetical protein
MPSSDEAPQSDLGMPSRRRANQLGIRDLLADLIQVVRQATERFKDVTAAQAAGYTLQFGRVTGPDAGAMGLHFVNGSMVNDGYLDPTRPEIVIYEPQPDGTLRLIGADFLVLATSGVQLTRVRRS